MSRASADACATAGASTIAGVASGAAGSAAAGAREGRLVEDGRRGVRGGELALGRGPRLRSGVVLRLPLRVGTRLRLGLARVGLGARARLGLLLRPGDRSLPLLLIGRPRFLGALRVPPRLLCRGGGLLHSLRLVDVRPRLRLGGSRRLLPRLRLGGGSRRLLLRPRLGGGSRCLLLRLRLGRGSRCLLVRLRLGGGSRRLLLRLPLGLARLRAVVGRDRGGRPGRLRDADHERVARRLHVGGIHVELERDHDARDRGRVGAVGEVLHEVHDPVADDQVLGHALEARFRQVDDEPWRIGHREGGEVRRPRARHMQDDRGALVLHLDRGDDVQAARGAGASREGEDEREEVARTHAGAPLRGRPER